MDKLRVLITNHAAAARAGSELYIRDIATAMIERGHTPIVYSRKLGDVASELRAATIPVIDNLDLLATTPDLIHGQDHLNTMEAMAYFPDTPGVFFCHGWMPWEAAAPRFPRILRYVAVDYPSRDRLVFEQGIPEERVRLILNFADLDRFKPRGPLPARPRRALLFSNYVNEHTPAKAVREACERAGIALDVIGMGVG
ncbi:MAG TPA: glycosyltransferase, partial [Blastocatellia bacterium]|nr:glycosyltransferase [Blastocatellia bacterium]